MRERLLQALMKSNPKRLSTQSRWTLLCALLLALPLIAASPEADIRTVLATQVEAWNRGDVEAFMTGYAQSKEILFVGKEVKRGYQGLLERYRRDYPDAAAMGKLRFLNLEVRMLGAQHATVLGRYHLTRTEAGGGDAQGIFTLIFEKSAGQWKIIQDHTTALDPPVRPDFRPALPQPR